MADKAISELITAEQITATDMFVLEQNGTAKKLTGQILLNWLTAAADGHGGISFIAKVSSSGLADTYRITLADTTVFDFVVTNGKGVSSIVKTSTEGLVDTYQISYTDGTSGTFTVTNGEKGDKGDNAYIWIKYASQEPTEDSHSFGDVPDDWIGVCAGNLAAAPDDWTKYQWFQIKGEKGDKGDPATLISATVTYQVGDSGTIIPSGMWSENVPAVAQGEYLWTKIVQNFNTGDPVTVYTVSRMGIDGLGSVVSVCGVDPDENGNVPLKASDVGVLSLEGGDMEGPVKMNGQKLSGLNAPTANDEAATKGYVDGLSKAAAPVNLLDNSNFAKPVNQRGATEYTEHANKYTVDRWKTWGLTYIQDGCIAHENSGDSGANNLYQYFESGTIIQGKTYTAACMLLDGTLCVGSGVAKDGATVKLFTSNNLGLQIAANYNDLDHFAIRNENPGATLNIVWAALYEGEYTADTLPEYHAKGYAAELMECLRYYQICSTNDVPAVDMRPPMRLSTPTITEVTGGYSYSADL